MVLPVMGWAGMGASHSPAATSGGGQAATVVAWVDSLTAGGAGDTVDVRVRVDMSAANAAIGSFQAIITFDTSVVRLASLSTGFVGTFTPNTDSAAAGTVRFAGINTSSNDNRDTVTVATLRMVLSEKWGTRSTIAMSMPEIGTVDFADLTAQLEVRTGQVLIDPGSFSIAVRGQSSVSKEESRPLAIRGYVASLVPDIGSAQGRVSFDPAVIRVDSITAGSFGGTFQGNAAMQTDSGFVRFAVANTSPPAVDTADLAVVWVTAVGQSGDSTDVTADMEEVAELTHFGDLLPFMSAVQKLRVGVTIGLWGDPNKDKKITALDALICLSSVVGKDVSQFDVTACDVAPDNGDSFTGRVTALDALAILSYVVGKALPATFRVGLSR